MSDADSLRKSLVVIEISIIYSISRQKILKIKELKTVILLHDKGKL